MDDLFKDIGDLLAAVENRLKIYQDTLEESDWADFDDHFRGIRREMKSKLLAVDELIRWS